MIREYAPMPLIPAAWAMTFLTVVYPGIDQYWIRHMHLFMVVFLGFFAVASWKQMDSGVMKTWRNIIAMGFIFTLIPLSGFYIEALPETVFSAGILYWILAPAYGFRETASESENFSDYYRYLYILTVIPVITFLAAILTANPVMTGVSFVMTGLIQASSFVMASYMDS